MNIVFISHRVPFPPNKGEKIRTFHQIKQLSELGHHIHLFSPCETNDELAYFKALESTVCKTVTPVAIKNRPLRLLRGLLRGQPMSVANFYCSAMQDSIDLFLASNLVDAIICSASSVGEYVFNSHSFIHSKNRPLLIMDFMDVDSDKWGQYQQNSRWPMNIVYAREQRKLAQCEQKIAEQFDACYLIAQAEVDLFQKNISKRNTIKVMGNGLDTDDFYPALDKPKNTDPSFLFTGVMDYKPNEDAVVWFVENCWQDILNHHPKAKFIIAGMAPSPRVIQLGKKQGIEVTGFVEDILPFYHQATIFVAPFRLARGVQNKILQAFACALPVIATPMGAEGILCQAEHDILLANLPEEFVDQALRLIEQPNLAQSLGECAERTIHQHYSWPSQLQPLVNLLKSGQQQ